MAVYQVRDPIEFSEILTEAESKLVVINFFTSWCNTFGSYFEDLSREFPNVVFLKVDPWECEEIGLEFEITSMPTFVFVKNKIKVDRCVRTTAEKLRSTIEKHAS